MRNVGSVNQASTRLLRHAEDNERVTATILQRFQDTDARLADIVRQVRLNATHDGTVKFDAIS